MDQNQATTAPTARLRPWSPPPTQPTTWTLGELDKTPKALLTFPLVVVRTDLLLHIYFFNKFRSLTTFSSLPQDVPTTLATTTQLDNIRDVDEMLAWYHEYLRHLDEERGQINVDCCVDCGVKYLMQRFHEFGELKRIADGAQESETCECGCEERRLTVG
ncbi:uncharacterized protein K460DRAFT_401730 [Cucurbitaria berberidis CBS 394.84]|uniref:Uncharacterized protein n=1 Tax=Cucurbitaria berberidis CBS 394.84 TaxID=1168544 RepID=A0A9P4GSG6_9PLEO|nr:uncharacterized protein K460DRAFT_401730 [Cucurbitaria berberidis CBS 394.84]KAF1851713.1 hypothetical protein K460DRAFT_401730 [Cucurbitaria berberidis CBS 394.84]